MSNNLKLNFFIEIIVLLFMPLSIYSFYEQKVSYGDVLLLLGLFVSFIYFFKNKIPINNFISKPFFIFLLLIILNTMFHALLNPDSFIEGLFSLLRYLLFLLFIIIVPKYFINKNSFFKKYQFLGFCFAIYSLLQFVFYNILHKFLPVSISFLPTMTDFSFLYNLNRYANGRIMFRPYSCFLEPGYFSFFVSFLLIYLLVFKNNKSKYDYICIVTIAIAMSISGSTGIFSLLLALTFKMIRERKKIQKNALLFLFVIIPFALVFINSPYGSKLINKIFIYDNNSITLGYSTNNRVANYSKIFNNNDFVTSLFGNGIWTESDYLPSFGRALISLGIPGTIIFFLILFYLYIHLSKEGKCYFWLFFLSLFVTNSLFTISFVLSSSIMIIHFNEKQLT